MSATKLEKLLINEVSGVDVPANLLDGWMIRKDAGTERTFGPETPWVVGDAEARIRELTKATDSPNDAYASCFLWVNKDAAEPGFADYKFLVSDVVDGEIAIMPAALDAVDARLEGSTIPAEDKAEVAKTVAALRERMDRPEATEKDATSILERVKNVLLGKEIDVTKDELDTALDARFEQFGEALKASLAEAVAPAPTGEVAPPEAPAAAESTDETEATPSLTADDIAKAIEAAQAPLLEILDKTLDRLETLERGGVRKASIAGQESGSTDEDSTPAVPTVKDAIAKALGRGAQA